MVRRTAIGLGVLSLFLLGAEEIGAHPHHHNDNHAKQETRKIAYRTPNTALKNQVNISLKGSFRYISSNGIPDHSTGKFPNSGNPNSIKAQKFVFKVPSKPKKVHKDEGKFFPGMFGVALNGIPFDPGTGETWDGNPMSKSWRYEALTGHINLGCDNNNAHVQPDGTYHYHGIPTALYNRLTKGENKMVLLGYAADGFPFYGPYGYSDPMDPESGVKKLKTSYKLRTGVRNSGPGGKFDGTFTQDFLFKSGLGDLDDCNGRFGVTPEYPDGIYHYYLTYEFPFVPRKFRGNPDSSFKHRGLPPMRPGRSTGRPTRGMPPHLRGGFPPPPPGRQGFRRPPQRRQHQTRPSTSTPVNRGTHIKQYSW